MIETLKDQLKDLVQKRRERDYYFPKNARKFGIQKININDVSNFEKRKDALKNVELSNCDQEDVFSIKHNAINKLKNIYKMVIDLQKFTISIHKNFITHIKTIQKCSSN